MANTLHNMTFTGTTNISGTLVMPSNINGTFPLANFPQRVLDAHVLPLHHARVWDAPQTALPTTAATDDLGLIGGTFGTHGLLIQSGDLKALGLTTRYCRFPQVILPANYDAGATVQVRLYAGMETTVSDTTATIDVEAYVSDGSGLVGADQCATAAQLINSVTYANLDFSLGTSLAAGDLLDIRIAIAVNDAATATAVIGSLGKALLLVDAK